MSDSNKEMIAATALHLFATKGYEGVGVQEICEASNITKPTLYHYFKSKNGLLEYFSDTLGAELADKIQQALIYEHDFIKSLTKVLQVEIEFACNHKDFFDFHCLLLNAPENSEQKATYAEISGRIFKLFSGFFELSCNEFGNMKGKEKLYSILFHNKVVSVASLCSKNELTPDDQTIYQIIHSTVYGVAN